MIDFVLDTGSPRTVMPFEKAKELNLPIRNMPAEEDIRILGTKYKTYRFSRNITIIFYCEDGTTKSYEFLPLIVKPVSDNEDNWVLTELIIGLDFLEIT